MTDTIRSHFSLSRLLGFVALAIGSTVLVGWWCDIPVLKSVLPGFVAMKANTAVGFMLAGLSLALLGRASHAAPARWLAQACAAAVILLGLLTLYQYLFGLNFGIDQALFRESAGALGTLSPGRMAPMAAFSFLLLGCALLLLGSRRTIPTAQRLVLLVGLIGELPLVGYLYGATMLFGVGHYAQMALHTSLLFLLLTIGVLLLHPADGMMRAVTGNTRGGWLLRRLAPFVVGIPLIFVFFHLQGERSGLFEGAFGGALMVIVLTLLLLGVVWWTARMLDHDDAERKRAEEAQRASLQLLEGILNAIPVRVFWKDKELVYLGCNAVFARDAGMTDPRELIGKDDYAMTWHEQAELYRADDRQVIERGCPKMLIEEPQTTPDGQTLTLLSSKMPLRGADGAINGILGTYMDITERKQVEAALRASEVRYRRLFESARDGILILDAETGSIVDVNPFLCELLNFTHEEFLGKKLWEIGVFADIAANEEAFVELQQQQYIRYEDLPLETRNGRRIDVEFVSNVYEVNHAKVIQCNIRDISARVLSESRRELTARVLATLNRTNNVTQLVEDILRLIKAHTGLEAVGIRLREGEDFPYFVQKGFSAEFVETENSLTARTASGGVCRDAAGNISLECTCGLVISGQTDAANPLFTPGGSFWTNESFPLLDLTAAQDPRLHPRNRCIHDGFHSVALIPLRSGDEIIGLLQLNDRQPNRFTLEMIQFFEELGTSIGIALDRKRTVDAMRESEARYRILFETSPDGILMIDRATKSIQYANTALCRMLGYTQEELRALNVADLHPPAALPRILAGVEAQTTGINSFVGDMPFIRKDGANIDVDIAGTEIILDGRAHTVGFLHDITRRKQAEAQRVALEEQVRRQQRLEAVGQLAAGIAHDFNNLLTGITGFTQLAHDSLPAESALRVDLAEVLTLAGRAADLTRRLLAFSHQQTMQPGNIHLNALVNDLTRILQRLLGNNIALVFDPCVKLGQVHADAGHLEQVLINLAINARDAMPDGGQLSIETANVELDEDYARVHPDTLPGPHVLLAVTDNGCGMTASVLEHIFEPFFTTKGVGKGTGLGLSMAYGIIKQHGGHIQVNSTPGHGTTFNVYLPRVAAADVGSTL